MDIELTQRVADAWLSTPVVRVGMVSANRATADRYALVVQSGEPYLRLDIYAGRDETFAFEEALLWSRYAVVGFGHHLHLVSIRDKVTLSQDLGSYFGRCYPTSDCLLVASAERVFRFEETGRLAWKSEIVGIDGVVLGNTESSVIRGEGEWDPPGGWRPFALSAASGETFAES